VISAALTTFGLLYALWLGYVLTMHIVYRWKDLPLASRILGAPAALLAYALDVLLNWTVCTVVFFDLPREKTITERLHRYRDGWRGRVARWVCGHLLNPFDPEHC
jgi:hypothetical protein